MQVPVVRLLPGRLSSPFSSRSAQSYRTHDARRRPARLLRARAETGETPAAEDDSRRRRESSQTSGTLGIGGNAGSSNPLASGLQLASGGLISKIWGDRPPTDGPLNYAQMLEYLANKRVLRLMIYDEGKNAIGATLRAEDDSAEFNLQTSDRRSCCLTFCVFVLSPLGDVCQLLMKAAGLCDLYASATNRSGCIVIRRHSRFFDDCWVLVRSRLAVVVQTCLAVHDP